MLEIIEKVITNTNKIKSKTQKRFLKTIIITILGLTGKANFRNMSRYCNLSEKTISRNFRKEVDFVSLNKDIILTKYTDSNDLIAAVDCSYIKKSGKKTHGLDKYWSGVDSKVKNGLEISCISVVDPSTNDSYMLDTRQTPNFKDLNDSEIKNKKKVSNRMDFYLEQCTELSDHLKSLNIKYIAFDAAYVKNKFVDGIKLLGFDMISKLRKDANLNYLYTGKKRKGKGRPKQYNGKVNLKEPDFNFVEEIEDGVLLYEKIVYSISMKRKIKIAYIKNSNNENKKNKYITLFSTNTNTDAKMIVNYYKARFQIEFLFRDAKQHTGLLGCQSTNKDALDFHFNISMLTLNLTKADHALSKNKIFSMNNYRRRFSVMNIANLILSKLEIQLDIEKNNLAYIELLEYGAIAC